MRHWTGVNANPIEDPVAKDAIRRISQQLAEHDKAISGVAGGSGGSAGGITSASYLTVVNESLLSAERALAVQAPITKSDGGANGSLTIGINTNVPTGGYGTTALAGSAGSVIRSDARFPYPASLMSPTSLALLTASDDTINQTLTGTLGNLNIACASHIVVSDYFLNAGGSAATNAAILSFASNTTTVGAQCVTGINANLTVNDGSTYNTVTHRAISSNITVSGNNTCTGEVIRGLDLTAGANAPNAGITSTFGEITGIRTSMSIPKKGSGVACTVTDARAYYVPSWVPTLGTAGTVTNSYCADLIMPNAGDTIRRGVYLRIAAANQGTAPANEEGFISDELKAGTTRRSTFYGKGATTGTPTNVAIFEQATAHTVGTFARSLKGIDPSEVQGGYMGSYAAGTFSLPTGDYMIMSRRLQLTGAQRGVLAGTATLRLT